MTHSVEQVYCEWEFVASNAGPNARKGERLILVREKGKLDNLHFL